jgi:hypothetical protein
MRQIAQGDGFPGGSVRAFLSPESHVLSWGKGDIAAFAGRAPTGADCAGRFVFCRPGEGWL